MGHIRTKIVTLKDRLDVGQVVAAGAPWRKANKPRGKSELAMKEATSVAFRSAEDPFWSPLSSKTFPERVSPPGSSS